MHTEIQPVELAKAYRLLNHGPTILVSAQHAGVTDVMAAAWACALDFSPPKLTVVLDKATRTRELVEASQRFVIQVPTLAQAQLIQSVGTTSLHDTPNKLTAAGVSFLDLAGDGQPFVAGCSAWLDCKLIPEQHNQDTYDLFIGEVTQAWADSRVFKDGHWLFADAPRELRSLHYIAGGQFYAIGESVVVPGPSPD